MEKKKKSLLRTCFCLGAVSSGLVAFFILAASSLSALSAATYDIVTLLMQLKKREREIEREEKRFITGSDAFFCRSSAGLF